MANTIHDKYEECFSRVIRELAKYRIARVIDHIHPEFDFKSFPNQVVYASARLHPYNTQVLERLLEHINRDLTLSTIGVRFHHTKDEQGKEYEIRVTPEPDLPKDKWMEDTERAICTLSHSLRNFWQIRDKKP